jgi:hypothetical protein
MNEKTEKTEFTETKSKSKLDFLLMVERMEESMNRMEKTLNKILTVLERVHGPVLEDWDEPGGPFEATLENSENEYIPESEVLLYGGKTTEPKLPGSET